MKQNDPSHTLLADAQELGHEARAGHEDHAALKLWLRMLASTTHIEAEIRRRLRERFDISLARFDYMAQLYRYRDGLKMRDLSRYLMVTGGNVTGLTDDLAHDGIVVRESSPSDRRAWIVRLTPKGRRQFETMAAGTRRLDPRIVRRARCEDGAAAVSAARAAAGASGAQRAGGRGRLDDADARQALGGMRSWRSASCQRSIGMGAAGRTYRVLGLHRDAGVRGAGARRGAGGRQASLHCGGRRGAATPLRCSTRGRIAELAAFAALTALKQPR